MACFQGFGICRIAPRRERVRFAIFSENTRDLSLTLTPDYGLDSKIQTNVNPSTGNTMTYGNIQAFKECLDEHHARIAAVIIECLHGQLQ
jgi:glutamate-1-semialdehyde aminotransferase